MKTDRSLPTAVQRFLLNCGAWRGATFDGIAAQAAETFGTAAPSVDQVAVFLCRAYRGKANLNRFHRDRALVAWLLEHGASGTIDDVRKDCMRKFGPDRTPSRSALGRFFHSTDRIAQRGHQPRLMAAFNQSAWIAKVAPHLTLDALHAACVDRFGQRGAPGRSTLQRLLRRLGVATAGRRYRLEDDREVATWLCERAARRPLRELRYRAVGAFGAGRVPSLAAIHRYLASRPGAALTRRKSLVDRDPEVVVWLRARRSHMTLDELLAACATTFGGGRTPSRSTLHRLIRTG